MRLAFFVLFGITIFCTGSCRNQQKVKALVFERREISNKRLIIKYRYAYHNNLYSDSAQIGNEVISADSIDIIIDPSNPEKSIPDFKN